MKTIILNFMLCCLVACQQLNPEQGIQLSGITMGTTYHILIKDKKSESQKDLISREIENRLLRINNLMSNWQETSEVSRFNQYPVQNWFKVSEQTYAVFKLADLISQQTQGAFDITVSPLVELWGFGVNRSSQNIPNDKSIKKLLENTGYQNLILDSDSYAIKKLKPVSVNLSAIAKGYAVDDIANYLIHKGYQNFLVEIGGEIRAQGNKPDGSDWRIAIEKPDSLSRQVQTIIKLKNIAVATSGDYRNYYVNNNQKYSHTINPKTGRPVNHMLASVTVLSDSSAKADALATAIMVMGPDKGFQFCEQQDISAFFIIRFENNFKVEMTKNFSHYLVNEYDD